MRYHARWVLPVTQPPIENGTVVESDGIISYVGPRADAPSGKDYDLGDAILLPGLVNTHTHLELTAMRGFLENCQFTEWIDRLRQSRNEILDSAMLLDSARLGIIEGLEAGITTYADTCSSGVVMQAMRELGVRGIMYQEVFGPDPSQSNVAMRELEERVDKLQLEQTDLVALGVSPHAPYTVSDALYKAAAKLANTRRLPLAMHIAESRQEYDLVVSGTGDFAERWQRRGIPVAPRARSPIALLEQHGALDRAPLLIHCVRVDDADIEIMVRHSCAVAHCPASNAKFGHGIAPLLPLLAAGIRVGMGSDSVASNNRMDILDEARLAVLIHRASTRKHDAFGAHQALELATIGGARALGLDSRIGSLEVGKDADLAAFRIDIPRTTPIGDPYSAAIFALPGRSAEMVTVKGKLLVDRGRVRAADASLADRVRTAGDALAKWSDRQI
ncbi:MAG TPA: amidohydrolase family protein [Gemmatimonadaceae bacterium]|jgi:5-methylthioadenosine/S-adenosylhomocysteine deaminase|nr:amidohydrolase family protein [Gemmatimonadaceae bacterium]